MPAALTLRILVIGATGTIAQVVLMRGLLTCFLGNELSLGVIMAAWLLLEALGSWLAGRVIPSRARRAWFAGLIAVSAATFPLMVGFARSARPLLGMTSGEVVSTGAVFLVSFLTLLPVSLVHGALFTLGIGAAEHPGHTPVGPVYVMETFGSVIGGLLLALVLIGHLSALRIALLVAGAGLGSLAARADTDGHGPVRTRVPLLVLAGALLAVVISPLPARLDRLLLERAWPGHRVLYAGNSHYGSVTVLSRAGQQVILSGGVPVGTLPTPEYAFAEEFVHIPLLAQGSPRRVLLVGGGLNGLLDELLKYPDARIDYCELDPALIGAARRHAGGPAALDDPRVRVLTTDARRWITSATAGRYDVILVSINAPATLQGNRYATCEFFAQVRERLEPYGILAALAPGSMSYLSDDAARVNRLLQSALQAEFARVRLLPGDFNLLLAASCRALEEITQPELAARLRRYGFPTRVLTPDYLAPRFSPQLQNQVEARLNAVPALPANTDARPIGVLAGLAYWSGIADRPLSRLLAALPALRSVKLGAFLVALLVAVVVLSRGRRRFALRFAVFTTGWTGATVSLLALTLVQVRLGVMYQHLALMTAAFMLGTALGGIAGSRGGGFRTLLALEAALGLAALLLLPTGGSLSALLAVLAATGFLLGAEYPLVNRIAAAADATRTAGALYAADLAGGVGAALVVPLLLLPLFGVLPTVVALLAIKCASLGLLAGSRSERVISS